MVLPEQPYEVERKFLVASDDWRSQAQSIEITQGYLVADRIRSIRVRISGDDAALSIKGPLTPEGRLEYEYPIPMHHAKYMLDELCQGRHVTKTRHIVPYSGHVWEIDEFHSANEGLIIAEVELNLPEEEVAIPPWVGPEVTGEPRFYNSSLADKPFKDWQATYNDLLAQHGE